MAAKRLFLLDENIVRRVVSAEMEEAAYLWLAIWRNCHSVLLSSMLADKYWNHARQRRRSLQESTIIAGFIPVLNATLRTEEKTFWVEDRQWAPRRDVRVRHPNDWFMLPLLEQLPTDRECVFVSDDQDTREDFDALGKQGVFRVRSATIEEALSLAQ